MKASSPILWIGLPTVAKRGVMITCVIGIFQSFAESYIITSGGPNQATLFYSLYLYQNAFQYFKMGLASAMAWILLIIALFFIAALLGLEKRFGCRQ
ncbi:MAG TPA: hypothetical protein VMD08_08320 [Candidatus Baltobacteraceae bacterium]|nr:hypothetical protein [Candidatus Baltobacteraceae bacterium]